MQALQRILVQHYMAENLLSLTPETAILDAVSALLQNAVSGAAVVDKRGNIVGILTEKDCLRVAINAAYHGNLGGQVRDFMSSPVEVVDADTSIIEIAERFNASHFRCYPVTQDHRLVGMVSRADVLRAIESLSASTSHA